MRNFILFIFVCLFSLSACKKSSTNTNTNTPNPINNAAIAGNWVLTNMTQTNGIYKEDGFQIGTYTASSSNYVGGFSLNSDGTYASNIGYDYQVTSIFPPDPDTYVDNFNIPAQSSAGTFSYNTTTKLLTFTVGGQSVSYTVQNLGSNNLELIVQVSSSDNIGGVLEESSNTTHLYFTK